MWQYGCETQLSYHAKFQIFQEQNNFRGGEFERNPKIQKWLYKNKYNFSLSYKLVRGCAAHIGMGGVKIKKEPRQWDEYVYRIS